MRSFWHMVAFCLSLSATAQEIGSVGRWLQNENRRNASTDRYVLRSDDYRWVTTYDAGYAEVFVRIPERGRFTLSLGDQEITNSNGMFRFFDVSAQRQGLSIWNGRRLLYRVTLNPRNNSRLVLDFFSQRGLFLLEEIDLNNVREVHYGQSWNDVWNHSYETGYSTRRIDFEYFLKAYEKQSFDSDKIDFFKMQKNTTTFTTAQIAQLMEDLIFDDNRLILAKEAYECVIDPQNYYQLIDCFSFRSNFEKLSDYIRNTRSRR